jgi:hypothetical protein
VRVVCDLVFDGLDKLWRRDSFNADVMRQGSKPSRLAFQTSRTQLSVIRNYFSDFLCQPKILLKNRSRWFSSSLSILYDDKRFILENSINTLAWGHYKIKDEKDKFNNHLEELAKHTDL